MMMQKSNLLIKSLSINTTKSSQNWRTQFKQTHLITQISSVLLQRHNWPSILQTLNLKSKLTPILFLQIINTTQSQPQISLNFFKWAIKNTNFQPDLTVQCKITHLLIGSDLVYHSKLILNSLIQNSPPGQIVESLIKCEKDSVFSKSKSLVVLGTVLDQYCEKGLCLQGLEVFNLTKDYIKTRHSDYKEFFSIHFYNTLLDSLQKSNEIKLALCFYCVMLRCGVSADRFTWRIVAKILIKKGKVDSVFRIIDMGMHDLLIYDLVIEYCSEKGMFEDALHMFDEMRKRKLIPEFNTFISILNGACRFKNNEMIEFAMESMVEKGYISKPLIEYNSIIQKLCDMKKTYAAKMFFTRACDLQSPLENKTYGCMLKALSVEAEVKDAMRIYRIIEKRRIQVKQNYFDEFLDIICNQNPTKEVHMLFMEIISRGYKPTSMKLSKYITSQCKKRRWEEAEELVNLTFEKSTLLEPSCYGALVKHYCKRDQSDLAIKMHDKIEKKDLTLDSRTYEELLSGLLREMKVKEAEKVFDYIKRNNLLSSESFSIMICGFCRKNELRKAMKLHDEMLEMGLKPEAKTYKRLISNFK